MVDNDDLSGDLEEQGHENPQPSASSNRKVFWRSASWSSSRTTQEEEDECGRDSRTVTENPQRNRYPPMPLTPRSQQNKARSSLPPLQPLAISRRSFDEWPKAGSDDVGEWPQPPTPSWNKTGERLKLDLSSIQRSADKIPALPKRDKIAFFDKECSKVAEHVYLGGDAVAKDKAILHQNNITHILNCVGFVCPEYFKSDFTYRTLWLQDSPSEDITSILYDVFDYFEDVREQSGKVFVHCCQGVSRSTSLVIAYLMWKKRQSFDDAFQYVKAARGIADPNMGFACQLLQCQKRVHAFPLSPSSLLRMYRMAPHSPYDPLHLVPRMLNEPSTSCLDSRGAFVVHIPSSIYIWVGKFCDAIMERDARGAACQFLRYERAKGPIVVVKDGEEPGYFWEVFSSYMPLMEGSDGGDFSPRDERRVSSYDLDFEIFQKAINGGVLPPSAAGWKEHETRLPARESTWSGLRWKFAAALTKEFVPAPKIMLSRVLSDSMLHVHSPLASCDTSSSSSSNLASSVECNLASLSLLSPRSRRNSSPAGKRASPSIAERRGGSMKSPKLSSACNVGKFFWCESGDNDIILESNALANGKVENEGDETPVLE